VLRFSIQDWTKRATSLVAEGSRGFAMYVVSGFSGPSGPPEGGHYVQRETALMAEHPDEPGRWGLPERLAISH
jgi:hypothetical protein